MPTNLAADVDAFTSNVFLVEGKRTVLIDPGANFDVVPAVRAHVDALDAVVLTHTHPDHVGNAESVVEAFDVEVWGYDGDHPAIDRTLEDGDEIQIGDDGYDVLHTPGHKDDHVCLYAERPAVLFAGDLVFAGGGFGRTDLEEGDRATLVRSIDRVLGAVDEDLDALHSGHGPSVTEDAYATIETARRMARG
ncbi:MAG: MBL fold metallo-hydrolase [Halanaeroarchaeum sp.]